MTTENTVPPTFVAVERRHYDDQAKETVGSPAYYADFVNDLETGFLRTAYAKWKGEVSKLQPVENGPLTLLDYGTGQGHHAITAQKLHPSAKVIGVDISPGSLRVARQMAEQVIDGNRPDFLEGNAHELPFADATFDAVLDFGTLSSLNFDKATSEILRVLKPGGTFIGIETFGHNPLTNLKRQWNRVRGSRTQWATDNILNAAKLKQLNQRFHRFESHPFALTTLLAGGLKLRNQTLLSRLETWDGKIFQSPVWKMRAFKMVMVGKK